MSPVGQYKWGMLTGKALLAPVAVFAATTLVAARGSSSPSRSSTAGASGGPRSNATQTQIHSKSVAFSRCVRGNGVANFPDPPANGGYGLKSFAQQSNGENIVDQRRFRQRAGVSCGDGEVRPVPSAATCADHCQS
jgi:hypothetical protein